VTEFWLAPYLSLTSFLDTGGWVLNWIFVAAILLWMLILERLWFFWRVLPRLERQVRQHWFARAERSSFGARRIRGALLSRVALLMRQTLPTIQVLIAICPLLGLLGTVTGMIEVFDVMALEGTADARATVPTMAGMVVGLSGLFFINRFQSRVRRETERFGDTLSVVERSA
jgi:biopolymer transport protein ExbB